MCDATRLSFIVSEQYRTDAEMFLFFILIFFCLICRYPNSHTHYFSCTLLYLFAEANSEAIQEQVRKEPSV